MQILHQLFKIANESQRETNSSPAPATQKGSVKGKKVKSKDTVASKNPAGVNQRRRRIAEQSGLVCKNLNFFNILRRKDIAKACFYSTLNLKRLGSSRRRQQFVHSMKMKKEDLARGLGISNHKADSASHAGNKVLPISETTVSSSSSTTESHDQCGATEKKEKTKVDKKTKTLSKMKELLRWAAAARSEKGGKYLSRKVLHFRNKATLKAVPDDDQLSNDSPKISFRWDVESCSTTSSAYSALSVASSAQNLVTTMSLPSLSSTPLHTTDFPSARTGNWITTDSDFVVLEL